MFDYSNGLWGLEGIDIDGDGTPDMFVQDIDGDGTPDMLSFDNDGDGISDAFSIAVTDAFNDDINGDGIGDITTGFDLDGDGISDIFVSSFTSDPFSVPNTDNGSIIPDIISFDTDADGIPDTHIFDTDGNGKHDTLQYTYATDTDEDGIVDTITTGTDYGMDGTVDIYQHMSDTDGDGIFDVYGEAFSVDADGDGILDSLIFQQDTDSDGIFDVTAIVDGAGNVSFIEEMARFQDDMSAYNDAAMENASNFGRFDTDNYESDDIIGNPEVAMQAFHTQETDSSCAVAAQEFVLDQLTGHDFSEAELRDLAEAYGWYSPDEGTTIYNMGNVLTEFGLSVSRDYGNNLDDISRCLENGGGVVVGVDIYELYDIDVPGEGANHAVQVIGIDKSDPENIMVIINDSGMPDGGGLLIPADNFMNAWEDSDYVMVEAYANA